MRVRDFVSKLEAMDDLAVVDFEVAREHIPMMIKAEEGGRNRAMLFQKVRGHAVPVVANLYGTYGRYAMAIGADEKNVWSKIDEAVANPVPSKKTTDAPC